MTIITRTNGQPFATEASARQQLTAKGLQDTHEVVPHEGGYALVLKKVAQKRKLKIGDKVRLNGYRNDGDDYEYGANRTICKWQDEKTTLEIKKVSSGTKVYAGEPRVDSAGFAFHVSEVTLVDDDPITLQPGDYVSTKGMTEEQYRAVARAFENAGCPRFCPEDGKGRGEILEWYDGALFSCITPEDGGRHLTIDQVLGATNAKPENGEDSHCPQDIRTIVNVNLHTQGDAQAFRDAFDNLKSGCGDFPTMTATHLDTVADPITTLKQARTTRDESEQAYQKALEEAREFIGDGFELAEVGTDGPLVDGEDMTDPANWREGDVVTCISTDKDHSSDFSRGATYTLAGIVDDEGWVYCNIGNGSKNNLPADHFRFHRRPA